MAAALIDLKLMFFNFATKGNQWDLIYTFNLADNRHCQELTSLIRSKFDFIFIDPLRAVSSFHIDANTTEFGKRIVRPLRKLITEADSATLIIHHNIRGLGKYAGSTDIKAAVWALVALRTINKNDPNTLRLPTLPAHDGKAHDADPILWRIHHEESILNGMGSENNCE